MKERIVIDESKGLIFASEEELYRHFLPQIQAVEKEFSHLRKKSDIPESEFARYEPLLQQVLDDPDEIWEGSLEVGAVSTATYLASYDSEGRQIYYIAVAYRAGEIPTFIFIHFPTMDPTLVERFRKGRCVYSRESTPPEIGAMEGDALSEGDELAVGLFRSMLTVRSDEDIARERFPEHEALREPTISEPDEVWRAHDLNGNSLVTFMKLSDSGPFDGVWYIVVTQEDPQTSSHALLFSFPTRDEALVDRYRHGENLQTDDVAQEASH